LFDLSVTLSLQGTRLRRLLTMSHPEHVHDGSTIRSELASILHHIGLKGAILILIHVVLVQVIYRFYVDPLRHIPGPTAARFTELWRTRRYALGRWHQDILDLHDKYGPVVRIAPKEISFVDKDALVQVYGHSTGTKKTAWYHTWRVPGLPDSFFNDVNPKMHSFKRKRVTAAYSMSTICSLEPQINHITQKVWSKFRNIADTSRTIDLQEWTMYYASDIVCQLGLGAPLGFVEKGGDVNGVLSSIHAYFYAAANLGNLPGRTMWINNFVMRGLFHLFSSKDGSGGQGLNNWITSQITQRLASDPDEKRPSDMLDHFLSMKDPEGKTAGLPDVAVEAGNLLGAGGDTTAAGIAVVLKYLLGHPEDYRRLQEEVDKAYNQHHVATGSDEHLSYDTTSRLPFLSACIKEGTRLVPSILWQLPRECPKEGITIAGHFIPPKATLSMSPIAQNRCKEIFGEDANEWRPQRFIVGDGGMPAEYVRNIV